MSNELISMNQVPDYLRGGEGAGMEQAKASDLLIPRLVVMQGNSKLVKTEKKFQEGDIVRLDTSSVFCPVGAEVLVTPLMFKREYLHWASRQSGQGILERSDDEGSEVARKAREQLERTRKTRQPVPTQTEESWNESHAWLFVHHEEDCDPEMLLMSFAKGSVVDSRQMISTIQAPRGGNRLDAFAFVFRMTPFFRRKPAGDYWVAEMRQAGFVTRERYDLYKRLFDGVRNVKFAGAQDEATDEPATTGVENEV